jgi:hypothetical protein
MAQRLKAIFGLTTPHVLDPFQQNSPWPLCNRDPFDKLGAWISN